VNASLPNPEFSACGGLTRRDESRLYRSFSRQLVVPCRLDSAGLRAQTTNAAPLTMFVNCAALVG
jgi:hypothetical protein